MRVLAGQSAVGSGAPCGPHIWRQEQVLLVGHVSYPAQNPQVAV